jgi:flagellar biosynthetic protein FliQ
MSDVAIVHVLRVMAVTGLKVAGPLLVAMLVVGTAVSLVQTITQIQEQAIAYVAKFAAVGLLLLLLGPWMLQELAGFTREMWAQVPEVR